MLHCILRNIQCSVAALVHQQSITSCPICILTLFFEEISTTFCLTRIVCIARPFHTSSLHPITTGSATTIAATAASFCSWNLDDQWRCTRCPTTRATSQLNGRPEHGTDASVLYSWWMDLVMSCSHATSWRTSFVRTQPAMWSLRSPVCNESQQSPRTLSLSPTSMSFGFCRNTHPC